MLPTTDEIREERNEMLRRLYSTEINNKRESGDITTDEFARANNCSMEVARRRLNDLTTAGILQKLYTTFGGHRRNIYRLVTSKS